VIISAVVLLLILPSHHTLYFLSNVYLGYSLVGNLFFIFVYIYIMHSAASKSRAEI
jgi:hypothetical protein